MTILSKKGFFAGLTIALWSAIVAFPAYAFTFNLTAGSDEELAETLSGGSLLLEISEKSVEEPVSTQEIIATAQADYRRLLAVLYDNGYYGPYISISVDGREASGLDSVNPPRQISTVNVRVTPGKQFSFGNATVSPVAPETTLPPGFARGETARVSLMRDATGAAIDGWRDQGHAKAELAGQKVLAKHREGILDADITIRPGPQLRFGELEVVGAQAVRPERIKEIAGLPVGRVYSPDELADAAQRLRRTGTFASIAMIEAKEIGPDNTLPITVRVAEDKPRRIGFGGELATIEGLTLSAYWLHRNLFGGAERLRIDGEVSGIGGTTGGVNYFLGTRFERPATFNEDTTFFALGEIERIDDVGIFSESVTLGVGIERYASDERTYSFGFGLIRANTRDAFGSNSYTLFTVPTGLVFDYRDTIFDARSGYYLDAGLTPFVALAGTDNGLLTEVDFRTYFTFGEERSTTLAFRTQLGSVAGPSLRDAPADFLFFSGGGGTVRGHEFQSLGVDIGASEDVGGRSFLGLSAEVRYRTAGALGFVGFFDAGYIGSEAFPDGSSGEWQSGAGLGVRYATPIGPIRVDLAVPTSGDSDSDFQVYIGIGQAF